jgi:hypothetical protein
LQHARPWNGVEGNSRKNAEKHGVNQSEAEERDMPYQSLIKAWLADDVNDSRRT